MTDINTPMDEPQNEGNVSPSPVAAYFMELGQSQGTSGPIGKLTTYLSSGIYEPQTLLKIYEHLDDTSERWFLGQRIDLLLGYVRHGLKLDHSLTPTRIQEIRMLQTVLRIPEHSYTEIRPAEVATILRLQLEDILSDSVIDSEEDLYQVQLQSVFGLGYDQYFAMTRVVFERVWNDLSLEVARGNSSSILKAKMMALEPVVRIALAQRRTIGALYT